MTRQKNNNHYDLEILLQTLKYATRQMVAELNVEQVVFHALHAIADFSNSPSLSLMLLNQEKTAVEVVGSLNKSEFKSPGDIIAIRHTPLQEIHSSRQPGQFDLQRKSPYPIPTNSIFHTDTKCTCIPLIGTKHKVIGFINFEDKSSPIAPPIRAEILTLLTTLIATALENARLFQLATIDGLTGLYIRRYFDIRLQEEITRLRRIDSNLGLIMLDLDHFKIVNDTYGHQQGDMVLMELATILKDTVRRDLDIPCRYGGEEFVIILPGTDLEGAVVLAERIRKRCEEHPYTAISGEPLQVTISGGAVAIDSNSIIVKEEFFKKVDKALYEAKESGRNRIRF
jgi:two-component system cell cycle response regulator